MAALIFIYIAVLSLGAFATGTLDSLTLGSILLADTGESSNAIIPLQGQGRHPQSIFSFTVPDNGAKEADIRLSTCFPTDLPSKADYDLESSIISILESPLPVERSNARIKPAAVSRPDCGGKHATLDFRAPVGVLFFVIVSSSSGRGTSFRLETSIRSSPPTPTPLPWGLDRIDQRSLPLDNEYSVAGLSGKTVFVYVLDSGVRVSHSEFTRANGQRNAIHGADIVERLDYATDCTGHGTHVAAKIAGKSYGVAKDAVIVSVRVTGCNGMGISSRVLEGLAFVSEDSAKNNRRPAVVTMSLSTAKSEAVNKAVKKLSGEGIPVVTAAGNSDEDSCNYSPSSENTTITVAASNRDDSRPRFSNSGVCVDLFAPGEDIVSAWHTGDHAYRVLSGTSFACPHVAGAVAVLLSVNPNLPSEALANMIYSAATFKTVANHSASSPRSIISEESKHIEELNNRLLYVRPIPSLSLERPAKDFMYIYTAFSIYTGNACTEQWLENNYRKKESSATLSSFSDSEVEDVSFWTCCPGSSVSNQKRCGTFAITSPRVFTQHRTRERLASGKFKALELALRQPNNLLLLRSAFESTNISVVIEPWVVDSDGNVFWTAPDLRADKQSLLSTGAIVAIALCSIVLIIVAAVGAYTYLRNRSEAKSDAKVQSAIALHLKKTSEQGAIQPMDKIFDPSSPREFMGFMRENSALNGNVLHHISSSASLRTPRNSGLMSSRSARTLRSARSTISSMRFPFHSTRHEDSNGGHADTTGTGGTGGTEGTDSATDASIAERTRDADDSSQRRTRDFQSPQRTPRRTPRGSGLWWIGGASGANVVPGTEALAGTPRDARGMKKGASFFGGGLPFAKTKASAEVAEEVPAQDVRSPREDASVPVGASVQEEETSTNEKAAAQEQVSVRKVKSAGDMNLLAAAVDTAENDEAYEDAPSR